jgi:hypothetical protein
VEAREQEVKNYLTGRINQLVAECQCAETRAGTLAAEVSDNFIYILSNILLDSFNFVNLQTSTSTYNDHPNNLASERSNFLINPMDKIKNIFLKYFFSCFPLLVPGFTKSAGIMSSK